MRVPERAWRLGAAAALVAALAACGSDDETIAQPPSTQPAPVAERGLLTSSSQTAVVPKDVVDQTTNALGLAPLIGTPASCDVSVNKIVYETRGPRDESARASGGVLIPTGCSGPHPVVLYHHGTTVERAFTMSSPTNGEMLLQLWMFAAQGYVVVMPDYHGYGDSTLGYHPYLHAHNTAVVSIDALRAAKRLLSDRSVATSGKLFLSGYSQGGHSAMATHREIERSHASEFTVTAAMPMAGPYALSDTFIAGIANPGQGASVFTKMTFVGYQKAYGDLYSKPEDAFQSPWVNGIESLIPGTLSFTELYTQGKLPLAVTGPGGLLTDSFVASFQSDPQSGARRRLVENDLLDWAPKAPTALCAGSRDPVVPFANTVAAATTFAGKGAPVTPIDVEQVPQFQLAIEAQVAAAPDLSTYHGTIVPPLCNALAKSQVFDPLR